MRWYEQHLAQERAWWDEVLTLVYPDGGPDVPASAVWEDDAGLIFVCHIDYDTDPDPDDPPPLDEVALARLNRQLADAQRQAAARYQELRRAGALPPYPK